MDSPSWRSTAVHVFLRRVPTKRCGARYWRRVTIPSKTRRKRSFSQEPHLPTLLIGDARGKLLVGSELWTARAAGYGGEAAEGADRGRRGLDAGALRRKCGGLLPGDDLRLQHAHVRAGSGYRLFARGPGALLAAAASTLRAGRRFAGSSHFRSTPPWQAPSARRAG